MKFKKGKKQEKPPTERRDGRLKKLAETGSFQRRVFMSFSLFTASRTNRFNTFRANMMLTFLCWFEIRLRIGRKLRSIKRYLCDPLAIRKRSRCPTRREQQSGHPGMQCKVAHFSNRTATVNVSGKCLGLVLMGDARRGEREKGSTHIGGGEDETARITEVGIPRFGVVSLRLVRIAVKRTSCIANARIERCQTVFFFPFHFYCFVCFTCDGVEQLPRLRGVPKKLPKKKTLACASASAAPRESCLNLIFSHFTQNLECLLACLLGC